LLLGADRQPVAADVDLEIIRLKAGGFRPNDDFLIGVFIVQIPAAPICREWRHEVAEQAIEHRVELVAKSIDGKLAGTSRCPRPISFSPGNQAKHKVPPTSLEAHGWRSMSLKGLKHLSPQSSSV